ncbi:hypothetical protein [Streptomyces cinereoruber]|uniref:hypothetical protein n=1 Tax=Streptomyces cinereoruber TaxID=67260 RepID=UPI00363126E7
MAESLRPTPPAPTRVRLALAGLLAVSGVAALEGAMLTGSGLWLTIQFPVTVLASCLAMWLSYTWLHGLPNRTKRRLTSIPLLLYVALITMFVVLAAVTAPSDRLAAAVTLLMVWALHNLYAPGFEPHNFALQRLRVRLLRAVVLRVATMWCGIVGLLAVLYSTLSDEKVWPFLLGATLSLAVIGATASHKVFSRFRKLCTSLNRNATAMIRALDDLRAATDEDRAKARSSALRAWDSLREVLHDRVDTGYHRTGTFVLPAPAIHDLDKTMRAAANASPQDPAAYRIAVARMRLIQIACLRRTDTLA